MLSWLSWFSWSYMRFLLWIPDRMTEVTCMSRGASEVLLSWRQVCARGFSLLFGKIGIASRMPTLLRINCTWGWVFLEYACLGWPHTERVELACALSLALWLNESTRSGTASCEINWHSGSTMSFSKEARWPPAALGACQGSGHSLGTRYMWQPGLYFPIELTKVKSTGSV